MAHVLRSRRLELRQFLSRIKEDPQLLTQKWGKLFHTLSFLLLYLVSLQRFCTPTILRALESYHCDAATDSMSRSLPLPNPSFLFLAICHSLSLLDWGVVLGTEQTIENRMLSPPIYSAAGPAVQGCGECFCVLMVLICR